MTGLQRRTVRNVFNGTANPKSVLLVQRSLSELLGKKINVYDLLSGEYSLIPSVQKLALKKNNNSLSNSIRSLSNSLCHSSDDGYVSYVGSCDVDSHDFSIQF